MSTSEPRIVIPQEGLPQVALQVAAARTVAALALVSEWGHGEDCRYDEGEAKCYCQREDLVQHLRAIALALGQRTPDAAVLATPPTPMEEPVGAEDISIEHVGETRRGKQRRLRAEAAALSEIEKDRMRAAVVTALRHEEINAPLASAES